MPKSLAIAYQMKRKSKKKSSGGCVESGDKEMNYAKGGEVADPMLEVTCPKCSNKFSHGGQVANDVGQGEVAGEMPNEFDALVLSDDMDFSYTGANSGDEIGGPDKDDAVARAMVKRKKAKA